MLERLHHPGLGLLVLRVVVAAVFIAHGAQKLFVFGHPGVAGMFGQMHIPVPAISAWLVIAAEFGGGILLLLGLLTRWAALALAVEMVVAILQVHLPKGFFNPQGFEFPLTLLAALLALLFAGPGMAALDRSIFRRELR